MDYLKERCKTVVYSIPEADWEKLIDLVVSKEKIFVYGSGRSGLIGQLFSVRMVQLGLNVYFVGDMTTPIIGKNDLTILISNTGQTTSVVQTAEIARRIGSHVLSLTSSAASRLAAASDTAIILKIEKDEKSIDNALQRVRKKLEKIIKEKNLTKKNTYAKI